MAPTFRHGKTAVIMFATAGSTTGAVRLSSGMNDSSLDRSVDTAETSVYGDGDKRYLAGLRDATFSIKGNYSSTHEKKLTAMLGNSTGAYIIYSPESTAAGRRKFKGSVIISSLKIGSPIGDKIGVEAEMQWTGAVTSTNW
jgi:hypothetical protein